MNRGRIIRSGLAAATMASIGAAWVASAQPKTSIRQPDLGRGAVIAAQGVATSVPACAQCHAYNGGSDGSGAFPRIAGQSPSYLAKELHDYASGVRLNAVMAPIAKALSSDDIADVTAYYASSNAPYLPLASPNPALIKRGEQLAKVGEWKRGFRNNSPDAMADVAKRLDKQEIAAVAAYFQQVDASALAATPPKK